MSIANESAVIDDEAFAVRRTIHIAAAVPRVWAAVTEPEHVSEWFGRVDLDGRGSGAEGSLTFPGRRLPLRVDAIDEPRSITYLWNNDDALGEPPAEFDEETATSFTFTLEAVEGGTRLTVVETGFERTSDAAANMASHRAGWTIELDKLVVTAEAGA
jgi:uncharacterized protein YndB with AHSA1/START domain